MTISNSTLSGNQVRNGDGGAIYTHHVGSPFTVANSTFSENKASQDGGAIRNFGSLTISNSTFSGNTADYDGAIDENRSGDNDLLIIINSTLSGNTATTIGGAISYASAVPLNIVSSVIAGNNAPTYANINGSITTNLGNNFLSDDPQLDPLGSYGDSTQTMRIRPASPLIGAGNCAISGYAVTTDQRGMARKTPCDIGAYETASIATPTPTPTSTPPPYHPDTIGVYSKGVFYLRNSNTAGPADITVAFGAPGNLPVVGDWNGDGVYPIGVYIIELGVFLLRDSNTPGNADHAFVMGNPSDEPIAGKWDNTMTHDGIGVYRPSNGLLFGKRNLTNGFADYTMVLGNPGAHGIAGDWDGNGYDSIGVYRPVDTKFYLANGMGGTTTIPAIIFSDYDFVVGPNNLTPVAGDWTSTGQSRVGFAMNGIFNLKNSFTNDGADTIFAFGAPGALPITGKWTQSNITVTTNLNIIVPISSSVPPKVAPTITPEGGTGHFD